MNQNEPKQSNVNHNDQEPQLERLILDYMPITLGSWKSHFKIFEFESLCNQ